MNLLQRLWLTLAVLALAACALPPPGAQQFVSFNDEFTRTKAATESWLDVLAVAERENYERTRAKFSALTAEDVPYLATTVDPPVTAAYRRGFATVMRYNELLLSYASGDRAAATVESAAALGQSAFGFAAIAGLSTSGAAAALIPLRDPIQNLAMTALAYRDGVSFREELIADAPAVENLLIAMRDGAPTLFLFFTATARVDDQRSRIGLAPAAGSGATLSEKERQAASLLAEWVVMMDATLTAHRAAVAAAQSGDPVGLASAQLALEAGARSADQIRRLIVGLR
ncbi:MAG: hypothetical protein AAFN79_11080 [Pseudomonadota bacterium]